MKEIILGDTHGREDWKRIIEKENDFTKVRFIGDYWDSFDIPFEKQYNNFMDILEFRHRNPDKVDLLIGNHDFHYLSQAGWETYSGYQGNSKAGIINKAMQHHVDSGRFHICSLVSGILFTHAGVTNTWVSESGLVDSPHLDKDIDTLFRERPERFRFLGYDPYGDNIEQSPLWVRPRSLMHDSVPFKQVMGHTRMKDIAVDPTSTWYFIDVLEENSKKYLILDKDGLKISKYD